MKFGDLLKVVESATSAEDVVGPDDDGRAKRVRRARAELHPDRHDGADRAQAEHAFARLEELLDQEQRHVRTTVHATFDFSTKRRAYKVDGLAFEGTMANLYNVTYQRDSAQKRGLLKIARSPRDADLINAEGSVLTDVWKATDSHGQPDGRIPFYPRPEEIFTYRDASTHTDRRAIVQRRLSGFVSLAEVSQHFRGGFDVRDLAWIWRRVLAGVSLAHDLGYVHGSLTPAHILIHPEVHGVQIVGWGQSVKAGETIKVIGDTGQKFYKTWYPPEVWAKEPASSAADIYTLNYMFWRLMNNARASKPFELFVKGCLFERPATRPQSAQKLLAEYDELLERVFGPRSFRVFPDFPGRTTSNVIS